jgi:hypothetical protein
MKKPFYFYFKRKSIGIYTFAVTGPVDCIAGLNVYFMTASTAASLKTSLELFTTFV